MTDAFWNWFKDEAHRLRAMELDTLTDTLARALSTHAPGLGVEVSPAEAEDQDVEVLFTAHRERMHFSRARDLVAAAPDVPGFRFIALRPAQDFDVVLETEGVELDGTELTFEPLLGPAGVGLRLFVPEAAAAQPELKDLLWLMLETGLGEEVASGLSHLEVSPRSASESADALPLIELPHFLSSAALRP
ncbi:MAG TPA: hypothetical protein VK013_04785 [Myxococcaceae bacterium]|nr:hypothetical protein [Myxococcaceae bacterium]